MSLRSFNQLIGCLRTHVAAFPDRLVRRSDSGSQFGRMEGGRGVRLAINQQGDRVRDEHVNVLPVIANESYEGYVAKYQSELETEFGADNLAPKPANARKEGIAKLR